MTTSAPGRVGTEERPALAAAVFDLDGVVTLTARSHFSAWKELFDGYLRARARRRGESFEEFGENDYRELVDGRPRSEGVRAFLASRGIRLPEGELADPPDRETVCGLGNRKNALYHAIVERDGVEVDEDAIALVRAIRSRGVPVAVASSSKNCGLVLRRAGLEELFDAVVDGVVGARLGLRGKPEPDIVLEALKALGCETPARAMLVEDATAGVEAGRRAGFGLVIGLDRGGNRAGLFAHGADWVVDGLGKAPLEEIEQFLGGGGAPAVDPWVLVWDGLDPGREGLCEALCALGNGVFATRGALEESRADGVHYPGTYVAGGYDRLPSEVAGRTVENEDLVNVPNWLPLTFRAGDGEWWAPGAGDVLEHRRELRLREGILVRRCRVRDGAGRVTRVESRRLVHMRKPHLAAIEVRLTPENWSGRLVLRSGLDGSVANTGVARYRQLANRHLEIVARGPASPEGIWLLARTAQSRLEIAEAARTRVFAGDGEPAAERRILADDPDRIAEEIALDVRAGQSLVVEKVVALYTSRDRGIAESSLDARLGIARAPSFARLVESHRLAWRALWDRYDIELEAVDGDRASRREQQILRLHVFHLLQTISPNTIGLDAGAPARGLHGEAYRGHVFWDELFILPFYDLRMPAVTRSLLLYRYHRLDAARALAREAGFEGAMFPWQSSSDGREATQEVHLNPRSGRWDPDGSRLQRHVNAAIVHNVWRYYEATDDRQFLELYGAEMVLEIARFWSSLARRNETTGRYEITGVVGPDEYHEKLPGTDAGGIPNNAYTNVMAVWCLARALDVLDAVGARRRAELRACIGIDDGTLERWREITRRMTVPFLAPGVFEQFEGYRNLEELDWDRYREAYGNVERLDRILKAEGRSPDGYKASKQADANMLFYVLRPEELRDVLDGLGYPFPEDAEARNVAYYRPRTSHGSTLSKVVFAAVVRHLDLEESCRLFLEALRSDVDDVQGGTTPEGIHLGAMAGTVGIVLRGYAGVELTRQGVVLRPALPARLRRLRFRLCWRERWIEVTITPERTSLVADRNGHGSLPVHVGGRWRELAPGGSLAVDVALPGDDAPISEPPCPSNGAR